MPTRLLIPAAGKGKRSGLDYPKCLHLIDGKPIIVRIIENLSRFVFDTTVIINPKQEKLFKEVFESYGLNPALIYQIEANGMGDAILNAKDYFSPTDVILLTWSDIPYLSSETVKQLVDCHSIFENDFSFATYCGENCYTIVKRNYGKLQDVLETKLLGIEPTFGERDIGLFIFRAGIIFSLLESNHGTSYSNDINEHGFLYLIKEMVLKHFKIEGYPIATYQDTLSFNNQDDLADIIKFSRKHN